MELEIAVLFILFIILLLWEIKADFFLLILGIAAYIFIVFYTFTSNPLSIIPSIVNFIFLNPLGLPSLFIPFAFLGLYKVIKKKLKSKSRIQGQH